MKSKIYSIWQNQLQLENLDKGMSFFDLGGDSLDAVALCGAYNKEFNINCNIEDIFKYSNIDQLTEHVISLVNNNSLIINNEINNAPEKEYYNTLGSQKAYFFICQKYNVTTSLNLTKVIEMNGNLDEDRLEKSFKKLINRHSTLRTTFKFEKGELLQKIHKEIPFKLECITLDKQDDKNIEKIVSNFVKPFILLENHLFRVQLVKLNEVKNILIIDLHHMISDGTSQNILVRDLFRIYNNEDLPKLDIQYKDYCYWYSQKKKGGKLVKEKEYWQHIFKNKPTSFNLPYDETDGQTKIESKISIFDIDKETSIKIKKICEYRNTSSYIFLIAAYKVFIQYITGVNDITVGSISSGRNHKDINNLVGVFINLIPVRSYIDNTQTFNTLLDNVKANVLQGLDNQDYKIGDISQFVNKGPTIGNKPPFNIVFNSHNFSREVISEVSGLKVEDIRIKKEPQARYDIINYICDLEDIIQIHVEYSTSLFLPETINNFMEKYIKILNLILSDPNKTIMEITNEI